MVYLCGVENEGARNPIKSKKEIMDNELKSVCVYSASSTQIDEEYVAVARELGSLLGQAGIRVVNGAGRMGLMAAVADAAMEAGGRVTGIIPRFMVEQGWQHRGLTELIEVDTMHERKTLMARMSDGVVALPGGCGTLEELLEVITWKQLGLYLKPIVILNVRGYYDPLLQMFERAMDQHFMRPCHRDIWHVATTASEALDLLRHTPQWDASVRKFAAL